ncbi:MAG: DUF1178 family protein [Pseudomonadota bacterium]
MIRYALNCERGHAFDSWFKSSAAYDKQAKRGLVTCPVCGSGKVEKAIMAPRLARTGAGESAEPKPSAPVPPPPPAVRRQPSIPPVPPVAPGKAAVAIMSPQERELRQKLKELRDHVTKNAHYVGPQFPEEARKMHYGEIAHRSIYGEASRDEAKALHEEGIEFHPLPVLPDEFN